MTHRGTTTAARILLAAVVLAARPARAAPQARFEPAFTSYGTAEGMVNLRVAALHQDEQGFLWVGTHDGLLRYDGRSFKAYRARGEAPASLADDYITALAGADSGRVWVGADRGGLQLFDPLSEEVRHYSLADPTLGPWRRDVAEAAAEGREGRLVADIFPFPTGVLLLLTDVGLVRFDPASGTTANLMPSWDGPTPRLHATAFCAAPDGRALAALSDGTAEILDEAGDTSVLSVTLPDSIAALEPVADGYLAATYGGVIFHLPADLSSYREVLRLPSVEGRRVLRDLLALPDGGVWISTTRGAYMAERATGSVHRVGDGEGARSLPDQEIGPLVVDRTGVIWLGTWGGLASLHPLSAGMERIYSDPDLGGAGVVAMADAGSGRAWLGTLGTGVHLLDRRKGSSVGATSRPSPLSALSGAMIFGLAGSGDAPLWIAAFSDGLWVLDGSGPVRKIPILGPDGTERGETVYSVFLDHAGDVWAGTYSLGLVRFHGPSRTFRPWRGADPAAWDLGSDFVWPISEDSRGRLWIGANNGGLSVVSRDRASATLYRAGPGSLSDDRVLTVFVDSRELVWVGTEGGGLNRFDPASGAWTTWTTEDGLPHDNVEGIEEDDAGRLWIGTGDGLARLDPATGEILVFREPAGLAGNAFYANAAYRDPDGNLYFGGPAGLTVVDPAAMTAGGTSPQAALTAFRIQGREAPLARAVRTELLDLEPDENFFAFEFAAMDFADVSQNRYRYRLEGLDADWVDAGGEPVANYTSVPPGRYTFRVAARNSDGIWNEDALALPIRVQAPFYRTLWFQSLVAVAVLSLVVGFYTYRLRQLEARQRLRLEIAGKLHDDIGANLSTIALKAEMVRAAEGLDSRRSTQLADVGRLARDTAFKVRETVWVVNTQYDTVAGLVGKMHDTADTILAGTLPYGFKGPSEVPDRKISMETRQNVHLLFKETLNNVVKHASASRVDVTVALAGPALTFRVVDDGVGFDPATAREGNGQRLMRQRAEALRGSLRVTSAPGAGTAVDFTARLR